MSMMNEADELRDRYECVFVKWGVRDDYTQRASVIPMTALKRAIYKFEKWLILLKMLNILEPKILGNHNINTGRTLLLKVILN